MTRRHSLIAIGLAIVVAALVSPLADIPMSAADAGDGVRPVNGTLFLQVRGTSERQPSPAQDHFVYQVDVFNMSNQKVGTVTHDFTFTSPTTLNMTSSFHLPNGEFISDAMEAIAPDSTHPGFLLAGIHSDYNDTIVADKGKGDYARRSGQVRMSGWHDANKFPQTLTFNDFYEVDLHLN